MSEEKPEFHHFAHLTGEGEKFRQCFDPFFGAVQREPGETIFVVSQGGRDVFLREGDIEQLMRLYSAITAARAS